MTFSSSLQRLFDLSLISWSSAVSWLGSGRLTPRQTPVFPRCVSTSSRPVGRRRWLSLSVRPLHACSSDRISRGSFSNYRWLDEPGAAGDRPCLSMSLSDVISTGYRVRLFIWIPMQRVTDRWKYRRFMRASRTTATADTYVRRRLSPDVMTVIPVCVVGLTQSLRVTSVL